MWRGRWKIDLSYFAASGLIWFVCRWNVGGQSWVEAAIGVSRGRGVSATRHLCNVGHYAGSTLFLSSLLSPCSPTDTPRMPKRHKTQGINNSCWTLLYRERETGRVYCRASVWLLLVWCSREEHRNPVLSQLCVRHKHNEDGDVKPWRRVCSQHVFESRDLVTSGGKTQNKWH